MGGLPLDAAQQEPNPFQDMQARQAEQARALQQHMAFAQNLQQRQDTVQTRMGDNQIADRLSKVLDSNIPKPARDFLYRELSAHLGIDPKSERSQQVGKLLTALEPDALMGLRRQVVQAATSGDPGQLTQLATGILKGDVDGNSLVGMISQAQRQGQEALAQQGQTPEGGEDEETPFQFSSDQGRMGLGGEPNAERVPTASTGPYVPPAPVERPTGDITTRRLPTQGETASRYQEVDPGLLRALGLDPRERYRIDDLARNGISVPPKIEDQNKLATEINTSNSEYVTQTVEAARLHGLFSGKPENLGFVGGVARTIESTIEQIKGAARLAGFNVEIDPENPALRGTLKKALDTYDSIFGRVQRTAEESAQIEGALISMAYQMARSRGVDRITNMQISQQLAELGRASSPDQFRAALADANRRALESHTRNLQTRTGRGQPPPLTDVSDEDIRIMARNRAVLPAQMIDSVEREIVRRRDATGPINSGPAKADPNANPDIPGPSRGERIPRQSPTLEEEERGQERTRQRQERRAQLTEQRESEALELARRRDRRAEEAGDRAEARLDRQERDARRKEIAAAFANIGRALAGRSAGSIGAGGGGGGGDQDAGAFKIAPGPQRRAPAPVQAYDQDYNRRLRLSARR